MKRTLLLIDDCAMMRRFLMPVFQDSFEVVPLENAVETLLWLGANPAPAAIVLDFELPEMNGLELLRHLRLRKNLSDIPVIVLSGVKDSEKRWQCLEAGADDFLAKPFHPKELALRMKKLLADTAVANCNAFVPELAEHFALN